MVNAVITYIDDNVLKNFEEDFLKSLRKDAKFKGNVYVIYYGDNKKLINRIGREYKANIFFSNNKYTIYNQRNIEIFELIKKLPINVTDLMCIDGGDVWFQKPIEEIFYSARGDYGFVEEVQNADKDFNFQSINKLGNKTAQKNFLRAVKGFKLINSGMIVGDRKILEKLFGEFVKLTKYLNQDYYGFDQAIFNYVLRKDGRGMSLPKKYCFPIYLLKNQFEVKKGFFYNENGELINIVHNLGWHNRILPNGKRDISNIPKISKKLPGSFWGITTYYNPAKYKNKIVNYRKFHKNSKRQGLKLLCIEMAFNNQDFELTNDDADILIQLRTKSILWQKERLINIGIKNLPNDCDKFAWLDADIIFLNDNWIKETCKLLESYAIVQPFAISIRLTENQNPFSIDIEKIPFENINDLEGYKSKGVAYKVSQLGKKILAQNIDIYGHVGLAWAGRKSIFYKYGILDKSIFPNSDSFMVHLFYNNKLNKECSYFTTPDMEKSIYEWADKLFPKINGSVYYTPGIILHLWHGSVENRNYQECHRILNQYNFNPAADLKLDSNGCWTWASDKKAFHRAVKRYFLIRKEDKSTAHSFNLYYYNLLNFYDKNIPDFIKKIKKIRKNIFFIYDRSIGISGMFIKRLLPSFYFDLKKLMNPYFSKIQKRVNESESPGTIPD